MTAGGAGRDLGIDEEPIMMAGEMVVIGIARREGRGDTMTIAGVTDPGHEVHVDMLHRRGLLVGVMSTMSFKIDLALQETCTTNFTKVGCGQFLC